MSIIYNNNSDQQYQNNERIALLKGEITAIDEYSYKSYDKYIVDLDEDMCCCTIFMFYSKKPLLPITIQLQRILLLEEELDDELSKPCLNPARDNSDEKGNNYRNKKYEYYELVDYYNKRISQLDEKIYQLSKRNPEDGANCYRDRSENDLYSHSTNSLLLRCIFERRLRRGLLHIKNSSFTYGAIEGPSTSGSNDTRSTVKIHLFQSEIATIENSYSQTLKEKYHQNRPKALMIVKANFLLARLQYFKDLLNNELAKPAI